MHLFAAFLIASLALLPLSAQTLTGRVVDETGNPLESATVVLLDPASLAQRAGTATDAGGHYTLVAPQPGTYTVRFSYVGREGTTHTRTLAQGQQQRLDVTLPLLALPADEVVVAAGRAPVAVAPLTVSNVTARALQRLPDVKDLPVLLAQQPSITYYSENGNGVGYTYLRLRGFDERRVAISINGIPQNDPEDLSVYWINFFDLQGAVTDIQIQRGAGTAAYGSAAIAGALNIVADPYKPYPYATLAVGAGAYNTRRLTAEANTGLLSNRYAAFVRVSRIESDGYRDWSWATFTRFFAGVTRYGDRSRLTVQAYGGPQRDGLAYYGIAKADNSSDSLRKANFASTTQDVEYFHQPHFEVLHDYALNPAWTLNQTVFAIRGTGHFDFDASWRSANYLRLPDGFADLTPEQREQPLYEVLGDPATQFRAYVGLWHLGYLPRATFTRGTTRITLGGEARVNTSLHWGRVQEAAELPAAVVGSANDVRVYQYRGRKTVVSAYGSALVRPVPQVAVQADLQVSRQEYRYHGERFFGTAFSTPFVFVNPRVGATLFPEGALRAYASLAYGQREPRLKDLYDGDEAGSGALPQFATRPGGGYDFSQPLVKPERGLNVEVGARLARHRARLGATLYLLAFRDEIVPSGGLDQYGVPRTGNADRTLHRGLELEGAVRLARGLDLEGNLTLSEDRFVRFTEFEFSEDGTVVALDRSDNRIAGFPSRTANAALQYEHRGFEARLGVHHVGEIQVDNSGSDASEYVVDPYALVDATLSYTFAVPRGTLRLSLDVNNVLDDKVLLYGTSPGTFFPAATRHIFAGLRYTAR